jgi:RNA polymerase sigma-70 factor (ECF subfamily)
MSSYPTTLQSDGFLQSIDERSNTAPVGLEKTDHQLVNLVLDGDETAFEQIFERHKRTVAVTASRFFRRHDEIEEIIQISFSKAFVQLASFRGQHHNSLSSWLARITANACVDTLRCRQRRPEKLDCDLSEHEVESLLQLSATDHRRAEQNILDRDLVNKVMVYIGEDERVLLRMLYAEDKSVSDVADLLGWSKSNVKIKAWRARNSLRKLITKLL